MKDISQKGYTSEEIWAALRGEHGYREVRFRYDLLDRYEQKKGELYEVESASVEMAAFSTIKRTARFKLREEQEVTIERRPVTLKTFSGKTLGEM